MHAKGAIEALGLAMRESYLKVMRISILLSAPLIDQNENNVASPQRNSVKIYGGNISIEGPKNKESQKNKFYKNINKLYEENLMACLKK